MLQQRSFGSVKIISIDRDELLSRLRGIARHIHAEHPQVASIRVFGSIARGDHVVTSDVDVLILVDGDVPDDPIERARLFYPYFDLPIGVDLLVWTTEAWAQQLRVGNEFVRRVRQEGLAL